VIHARRPDHHGYIGRMQANGGVFSATTPDRNLEILIGQLVNLVARRSAGADEQSGPGPRIHCSRIWSTQSASTRPDTPWLATR